ncbi:MAG: hypothetical protein H0U16_11955 [Actinobacteria bacterium]|nr:hypothetical protein [Actinomycetota bacterium]
MDVRVEVAFVTFLAPFETLPAAVRDVFVDPAFAFFFAVAFLRLVPFLAAVMAAGQ